MLLQNYKHMNRQPLSFQAGAIVNGRRGRPKCDISREKLEYELNYHLSVPDIAMALGVSRRTGFRRMRELDLSVQQRMTVISALSEKFNSIIREIQQHYPKNSTALSEKFNSISRMLVTVGFTLSTSVEVPELVHLCYLRGWFSIIAGYTSARRFRVTII